MEIHSDSETGGNSHEHYDAMLILIEINTIMIIRELDLIDVINNEILLMHSVIVAAHILDYRMKYYLLTMKIQKMLQHITIKLSFIDTVSHEFN